MIYIYFVDIFKCKLVHMVVLCVKKHNYVPQAFLFQMFI